MPLNHRRCRTSSLRPLAVRAARRRACALVLAGVAGSADAQPFVKDGQERSISTWAAKGLMQNPVAICFDPHGNMYIAETDRAGNAVADTRGLGHLNAVEEDLQFKSVEDRRAQIRRWIERGAFPPDHFTRTEDRVRIVRDTDADGVADTSSVFAGGFNDEVDGIGAGVLWHGGSLYYTCIPDLWRLTPGPDPAVAESRESLSHGYGVRWCFYGHDLHGLTPGPDGRLYFSMGDRGFNLTAKEGASIIGPDRGGVFRCWPDGTGLELFHQGLRNPQELAFNETGDLFTGDNNCDSGDSARVVHVTEGGDSGWRQDVQSLESRGPWNREAMWKRLSDVSGPARPAWSMPPIEHMCAGPSGLLLYPGTGESSKYDGCLFLVDFYGSGSTVHAFRPTPEGAGYKVTDHVEYYKGVTITDIAWGYDGRLYMSDWGGGWEPNPNGSVYVVKNDSVHGDVAQSAAITHVRELFERGFDGLGDGDLLELLGHRDQRVRLAAQYELASRGPDGDKAAGGDQEAGLFQRLLGIATSNSATAVKRYHAIWCMGQMCRSAPGLASAILPLASDPDPEIRVQAVRTIGDLALTGAEWNAAVLPLAESPDPRVAAAAAIALGKMKNAEAIDSLLALLERAPLTDPSLRDAAAYGLSLLGQGDRVTERALSMGAGAQLGAVVALRRLQDPSVAAFLSSKDPAVAIEAARAVYDLRVEDGMAVLAEMLDRPIAESMSIEPFLRRAIEANVYLGSDECAGRLAAFASRAEVDSQWRLLALQRVANWNKPLKREGVWGNWADYPARSGQAQADAVARHIDAIAAAAGESGPLAALAQQLMATYSPSLTAEQMLGQLADSGKPDDYRRALLDRVAVSDPGVLKQACETVLAQLPKGSLRARAEELYVTAAPAEAVTYLQGSISSGDQADCQRAARLLGEMESPAARAALNDLADRLTTGMLSPSLALEVFDAAMKLPPDAPARRRAESLGRQGPRPLGFSDALLLAGGNPSAGREVVLHHTSAECVRCHIVKNTGGTAGPNLTDVASRLTPAKIVESIVEPAKFVASGYGSVSAMPQMTQILTPRQVRDVVAYLRTLKGEEATPVTHGTSGGVAPAAGGGGAGDAGHVGSVGSEAPAPVSPLVRVVALILLPVTIVITARALGKPRR
jgi:quinoprotein glucose dehydrogenase